MISWSELGGAGKVGETTKTIGSMLKEHQGTNEKVIRADDHDVRERRAAYVDVSDSSEKPLRWREETLTINASVVDVEYEPENSAWLVDLELPKGS